MTLASLQSQAEDEAIRTHIESINSFINGKHIIAWYCTLMKRLILL